VVAQVWASLSLLAPDRVFLGIGTGEKLNEGAAGGGWGSYEERVSRLVEAVKIVRALWTGKHVRIKGEFWDVDGRLYDPPVSRIPIYVAAGGPKSARIAGLYGDGMITGAGSLKTDPRIKAAWEDASREASGGRAARPIVVEHWAVIGDEQEAREAAKKWRFIPRAWEPGFFDDVSPVEIQSRSEKDITLEEVLKDWTVSTEPGDHVDAIKELADLGATHVVVHVPTPNQSKVIDFLGRKVLPALRAA
jgi:alkanesulfonate monooxygenase SsuD/methylene tetrahydromethanopterin reductase-like flavin-dependent oxidoreductase (luciferase family)